jgi:hypothetical protein
MKLSELPAMLVERIEQTANGIRIHGRFDRLDGVRNSGYLRLNRGEYAWAVVEVVDRSKGTVFITDARDPEVRRLRVGERYPWFDDYWRAPLVEAIADEAHIWRQFTFEPSDATQFRQGGVMGWQKVAQALPNGAIDLGIKQAGWNHEHCGLCGDRIDREHPVGYVDEDEQFLCSTCYQKYGATHDLSFQVGA